MALLGGLIHNFTITDTRRCLQKYTVYKIHMISFPRNSNLFSSLAKLTIWKRYSDFKTLEVNLSKIYKNYYLKNFFKSDNLYFKRFDQEVIEQRKVNILEFLYYCAANPVLYRSQYFVRFFEDGNRSPVEETKNIDEFGDNGSTSSMIDDRLVDRHSIDLSSQVASSEVNENPAPQLFNGSTSDECSFDTISTDQFDYLYDAAMSFSQAVQEEANLRYKPAFELYKIGIDKLLTGAKSDKNDRRKQIAKTKAAKYLERAEMLYENQIVRLQDEQFSLEHHTNGESSVLALERPVNNLSRFKVIAVNSYLMRVQDCTDKKLYVLKRAHRDQNCTILLPQSIPFMVKLVSYYKTENSLFLLLPLISGGLLWDYVYGYNCKSERESKKVNLEEMFVEPPTIQKEQAKVVELEFESLPSVQAHEILTPPKMPPMPAFINELNNDIVAIPSFETLSSEMDINDLMNCSQKLLQSVSKTLEKSQEVVAKEVVLETLEDDLISEAVDVSKCVEACEKAEPIMEQTSKLLMLPETVLRQWFSELIVSVNSLHKAGIICGDLNLNNILLGPKCHIALTYFYQVDRNEHQQLCQLNPNAMKGHYIAFDFPITQASDWYSVGVILYEITTRERFYLNHPAGISRFNEIQYSNPDNISEEMKSLLHGLIIEKFERRFKYDDVICHPFFDSVDWKEIEKSGLELFHV